MMALTLPHLLRLCALRRMLLLQLGVAASAHPLRCDASVVRPVPRRQLLAPLNCFLPRRRLQHRASLPPPLVLVLLWLWLWLARSRRARWPSAPCPSRIAPCPLLSCCQLQRLVALRKLLGALPLPMPLLARRRRRNWHRRHRAGPVLHLLSQAQQLCQRKQSLLPLMPRPRGLRLPPRSTM